MSLFQKQSSIKRDLVLQKTAGDYLSDFTSNFTFCLMTQFIFCNFLNTLVLVHSSMTVSTLTQIFSVKQRLNFCLNTMEQMSDT